MDLKNGCVYSYHNSILLYSKLAFIFILPDLIKFTYRGGGEGEILEILGWVRMIGRLSEK